MGKHTWGCVDGEIKKNSQKWLCGLAEWDAFNELILEIHYVVSGEET